MNRHQQLLVCGVVLLLSLPLSCIGSNESSIEMVIVLPETQGTKERIINLSGKNAKFHVLLKNTSDKPQRIWQDFCSWGYTNLSFEMIMDGKKISITKKEGVFFGNVADYWTVSPEGYVVFDVDFTSDDWSGLPEIKGPSKVVQLKAVYEIKPDDQSEEHGVWTGRIESKPIQVTLYL